MIGVKTRKSVPAFARRGEIIEIETLATHPRDNGFSYSSNGQRIPRHIINRYEAIYNGEVIFRADWHVAISTNPFISLYAVASESGRIEFRWYDDDGAIYTDSTEITVT